MDTLRICFVVAALFCVVNARPNDERVRNLVEKLKALLQKEQREEDSVVVIDLFSDTCKAGFAGANEPAVKIKTSDFGQAIAEDGMAGNLEDMTSLLTKVYEDLGAMPENQPVLFISPASAPRENMDKLGKVIYENLEVPSAAYLSPSSLAFKSIPDGSQIGVFVNCGMEFCTSESVYEMWNFQHTLERLDIGQNSLTEYLQKILQESGYTFRSQHRNLLLDIQKQHCYVAFDFEAELEKYGTTDGLAETFQLPNGNSITIGNERFRAPEVLFEPSLIGKEADGLHQLIYATIMKSDVDLRNDLYANILLSGESLQFPGLIERLTKELMELSGKDNINIRFVPDAAWAGGAQYAADEDFEERVVYKEDYDDMGAYYLYRNWLF